ncbi:hypothetical protein GCM10017781_14620 [Deinococcus metalli]|uniref:Uncharacterized protein n=1 Tax=Deinococcus metalli TaxID=1141878 RepID=A0ABQ3JL12_9DEIO|nr:hypothetical protein GCM10017781_14620 [Deinococcus metalli]
MLTFGACVSARAAAPGTAWALGAGAGVCMLPQLVANTAITAMTAEMTGAFMMDSREHGHDPGQADGRAGGSVEGQSTPRRSSGTPGVLYTAVGPGRNARTGLR